jgi:ribosome biogenesis GTPase
MIVVASFLNPKIKWGLIDRYLVLAEFHQIDAIILLNKSDLLKDADKDFQEECEKNIAVFRAAGYEVIEFEASGSSKSQKAAIFKLGETLKGKVSMLSGHSGVGKSSIVNLFDPELIQTVEENSDISYKGRHTTSFASMIKLKNSGYVIDTPGIRSFVLESFDFRTLVDGFREFRPFVSSCKYAACTHIDEPGCGLFQAYEGGLVDTRRYLSYRNLLLDDTGREGRAGLS